MTEIVDSRCKDCSSKSFQCTPCSKKDVTVRKQMVLARKAQVLLSAYKLKFDFPAMPPPAPLVANGQVLYPPPATSPIKRLRDQFSLSSDDEVALKKPAAPKKPAAKVAQLPQAAVVQVAVTPKKPAAKVVDADEGSSSSSETCSDS